MNAAQLPLPKRLGQICWKKHDNSEHTRVASPTRKNDALPLAVLAEYETPSTTMEKQIVGFHQDEEQHWVAELECGHNQHVRHNPPWTSRPWVVTTEGRNNALGSVLDCIKCDQDAPRDWPLRS